MNCALKSQLRNALSACGGGGVAAWMRGLGFEARASLRQNERLSKGWRQSDLLFGRVLGEWFRLRQRSFPAVTLPVRKLVRRESVSDELREAADSCPRRWLAPVLQRQSRRPGAVLVAHTGHNPNWPGSPGNQRGNNGCPATLRPRRVRTPSTGSKDAPDIPQVLASK